MSEQTSSSRTPSLLHSRRHGPPPLSPPPMGIDLGTSSFCVGVLEGHQVRILPNEKFDYRTLSCVAFDGTCRKFGDSAYRYGHSAPLSIVFGVKRLIGRKSKDPFVLSDKKNLPFHIKLDILQNAEPYIMINYNDTWKTFTAEEISSYFLRKAREMVDAYLRGRGNQYTDVRRAVIAVPACFNQRQRQATMDAASIAGVQVIRLINEPTAAAIAHYKLKNAYPFNEKNVLIFDLGAGTFDVSLVHFDQGHIRVMANAGDPHLGGEDFNDALVEYFAKEFQEQGLSIFDNPMALWKLRDACEAAKKELSFNPEATIRIENLYGDIAFTLRITRVRFEMLNESLFMICMDLVNDCLRFANIRNTDVDDIVLIGGSTVIPRVLELLRKIFIGKQFVSHSNTNEYVALGATALAGMLDRGVGHLTVNDVYPWNLYLENPKNPGVMNGLSILIPRNTTLPMPMGVEHILTTSSKDQNTLSIELRERGMSRGCPNDQSSSKIRLLGIPMTPIGIPIIRFRFRVNDNGMLDEFSAVASISRRENAIQMTEDPPVLRDLEVRMMTRRARKFDTADQQYNEQVVARFTARNALKKCISDLKMVIGNNNTGVYAQISVYINECTEWLNSGILAEAWEYDARNEYFRILKFAAGIAGGIPHVLGQ